MLKPIFKYEINFDNISSTNDFLKQNYHTHKSGTMVFAKTQTTGRGRFDRKWEDESGSSILSSFLLKNIKEPFTAIRLSFLFSIAIKRMLLQYIDKKEDIVLKWPNDILIKKRKICGILSEYIDKSVIIGVGINIFNFNTSKSIENIYTSISQNSTKKISYDNIKNNLIKEINNIFNANKDTPYEDFPLLWFKEAQINGKNIQVKNINDIIYGKIISITNLGVLIIEEKDTKKIKQISAGDITYL